MTDSPVTKTAETVLAVAQVLREAGDSAYLPDVERALREAGLLVSGAPSEEQIERAARAAIEVLVAEFDGIDAPFDEADTAQALEMQRKAQRAALTAAGVGSPVPVQVDEGEWQFCYVEKWADGSGVCERVTFKSEGEACEWLANSAPDVSAFNEDADSAGDWIVASIEKRRVVTPGPWLPVGGGAQ